MGGSSRSSKAGTMYPSLRRGPGAPVVAPMLAELGLVHLRPASPPTSRPCALAREATRQHPGPERRPMLNKAACIGMLGAVQGPQLGVSGRKRARSRLWQDPNGISVSVSVSLILWHAWWARCTGVLSFYFVANPGSGLEDRPTWCMQHAARRCGNRHARRHWRPPL